MTREQRDRLPPEWYGIEAREPKGGRILELTLFAVTAFFASMGGLVAGGSWIFLTQREATVIRADIASTKTDVAILSAQFHDHLSFILPNDTPSRTASMYPGAHR
jgi:hypothetical protein